MKKRAHTKLTPELFAQISRMDEAGVAALLKHKTLYVPKIKKSQEFARLYNGQNALSLSVRLNLTSHQLQSYLKQIPPKK
ncbi:hypothetical protein NHP190003_13520 [Helicobacter sp. NHP19-003]|uniref:Uncharacterized protein n=1 Tax=Helicobacter gastrocanis TaxID=2849641 RepID=A0ABM7SJ09_9HELI|nr:hypothetical protein NHP190003_13520 [Helicobacter sp. NHP19-003]